MPIRSQGCEAACKNQFRARPRLLRQLLKGRLPTPAGECESCRTLPPAVRVPSTYEPMRARTTVWMMLEKLRERWVRPRARPL